MKQMTVKERFMVTHNITNYYGEPSCPEEGLLQKLEDYLRQRFAKEVEKGEGK